MPIVHIQLVVQYSTLNEANKIKPISNIKGKNILQFVIV